MTNIKRFKYLVAEVGLLCVVLFVACREKTPQLPVNKLPKDYTKENLLEMNIALAQKEMQDINNYLDTLSVPMKKSEGGFWYVIKNIGDGDSIWIANAKELSELLDKKE